MPLENKSGSFLLRCDQNHILNRYWELANLDTASTKGSITGQLKALDTLRKELALALSQANKSPAKDLPTHQIYRSAWMKQ